uniref:Uncharacterized protein n=1 Tax=Erpetoichthys calabaricus TaxID=27687 RepID=A0A8C4RPT2_ERPCA
AAREREKDIHRQRERDANTQAARERERDAHTHRQRKRDSWMHKVGRQLKNALGLILFSLLFTAISSLRALLQCYFSWWFIKLRIFSNSTLHANLQSPLILNI